MDKPQGWTSHDVVGKVRRLAGTRKVGHAGTLDPMATGVLVVGINRATRLLTYIVGVSKVYTATIRLGQTTITDDAEGEVVAEVNAGGVPDEEIIAAAGALTGELDQVPSSVSAIKVNGERAYSRVRSGEEVSLPARPVTVSRFEVRGVRDGGDGRFKDVDVLVECSSGTYVRALARDLGKALGVGGHLTALRRIEVGPYSLDHASTLDQLAADFRVLDLEEAARVFFRCRELTLAEANDVSHGRRISAGEQDSELVAEATSLPLLKDGAARPVAGFAPDGSLVALLEESGGETKPVLVFAPGGYGQA